MGTDNFHHKSRQAKLKRTRKVKSVLPYILIVCEGEKTEPNYFEWYRDNCKQEINIEIFGEGKNTTSLVRECINIRNRIQRKENIIIDQVWCVFDRDSFKDENYNGAFQICENSGILPAYSNECFEIWYLLHFNYYNSGMSRVDAYAKLDKLFIEHFGKRYTKNMVDIYELLECNQDNAIKHAIKLENICDNKHALHHQNPSTSVHKLVMELNRFKR